jgi:hypothetical protein
LLDATPSNFHDKKYKGIDPPLSPKVMIKGDGSFSSPKGMGITLMKVSP